MRPFSRRLVAAGAVLAAFATASTAHAAPDPQDVVRQVVAAGDRAVDQAVGGDIGPVRPGGGVGDIGGVPHGSFPPAGFAVTAVTWTKLPGAMPAFTPPGPGSHPANWSCATSINPTGTTARAECTPTDPPDPGTSGWACYDPYVVGDVNAGIGTSTLQSVTGTTSCGTSAASCTATTTAAGVGHCSNWSFTQLPVPLVCEADFTYALAATSTVRCAPIDP